MKAMATKAKTMHLMNIAHIRPMLKIRTLSAKEPYKAADAHYSSLYTPAPTNSWGDLESSDLADAG